MDTIPPVNAAHGRRPAEAPKAFGAWAVPVDTQRAPSHLHSPSGERRPTSPGALIRRLSAGRFRPPGKGAPAADQRSNLCRVPDLSHLWQRFLLASALIFGLLLGFATTVFGYST